MIGQSLRRFEDARFLTGAGRYVADLVPEGALHLAVVRSPHAHARVLGIDHAAAGTLPGVVGVFTAADLAGLGPIPCTVAVATEGPMQSRRVRAGRKTASATLASPWLSSSPRRRVPRRTGPRR